jgi:aryl-alcohol dehydrogenase-like predicted oxidoreductase
MESPFPGIRTGLIKTTDKVNFNDAWADIEKILETGKVRAIGVSNFSIKTCVLFPFFFRFSPTFIVASCQPRETFHDSESDASS